MRKKVILICSNCLSRNYTTYINQDAANKRFEINKYCPKCNQYSLHKESK